MGIEYPIVKRALSSLIESDDYRVLLDSIVALTDRGTKELLSVNSMGYILHINVTPNLYLLQVDAGSSRDLANILMDLGGAPEFITVDTYDGNPDASISVYEGVLLNRFLKGTLRILSDDIVFSNGSKEMYVDKELRLYSTRQFNSVKLEVVTGFNGFFIPKESLIPFLNKTSYRNLLLGNSYKGNDVDDLKFEFLENIDWEYSTKVLMVTPKIGYSNFKFLPNLSDEFCDKIIIGDFTYKVLAASGNVFQVETPIELGEHECKVLRKLGTYKKSFLVNLDISDDLREDLPFNFLPESNDYRLSVAPLSFNVPAVRNELQIHMLGTDDWEITEYTEGLIISKLSGSGYGTVSVEVPSNLSSEAVTFTIKVKPMHSTQVITVFINQLAESFIVESSWDGKTFEDRSYFESIKILSSVPWEITKSSEDGTDWVSIFPTSGEHSDEVQTSVVQIKSKSLPYTSLDAVRSMDIYVTPNSETINPVKLQVVQNLNPIFESNLLYDKPIPYSGGSVDLTVRSNFEYTVSGALKGSWTSEDMKLTLTKVWTLECPFNSTGLDRTFNLILKSSIGQTQNYLITQLGSTNRPSRYTVNVVYRRVPPSLGDGPYEVYEFTPTILAYGAGMDRFELFINVGTLKNQAIRFTWKVGSGNSFQKLILEAIVPFNWSTVEAVSFEEFKLKWQNAFSIKSMLTDEVWPITPDQLTITFEESTI